MARHRSPRGRDAYRTPPPSGALLAAGAGGAHRSADPPRISRRGLIAAGGAVVLVGQATFSHLADAGEIPFLGSGGLTALGASTDLGDTRLEAAAPHRASLHDGFEPVTLEPEPAQADADSLVKASGLAQAARAAGEASQRAAAGVAAQTADRPFVRGARCAPDSAGFGAVKSWVSAAGHALRCVFDVRTVGGVAGRAGTSDHPFGLALDFMVNRATGDKLADYALRYRDELDIKYVIWKQRINFGSGWRAMEDRGSVTANHFDHVHISFDARP